MYSIRSRNPWPINISVKCHLPSTVFLSKCLGLQTVMKGNEKVSPFFQSILVRISLSSKNILYPITKQRNDCRRKRQSNKALLILKFCIFTIQFPPWHDEFFEKYSKYFSYGPRWSSEFISVKRTFINYLKFTTYHNVKGAQGGPVKMGHTKNTVRARY